MRGLAPDTGDTVQVLDVFPAQHVIESLGRHDSQQTSFTVRDGNGVDPVHHGQGGHPFLVSVDLHHRRMVVHHAAEGLVSPRCEQPGKGNQALQPPFIVHHVDRAAVVVALSG